MFLKSVEKSTTMFPIGAGHFIEIIKWNSTDFTIGRNREENTKYLIFCSVSVPVYLKTNNLKIFFTLVHHIGEILTGKLQVI